MPTQSLPRNPSFENLQKQAKTLHKAVARDEAAAVGLAREFYPRFEEGKPFSLTAAQLVIARQYGFSTWPALKKRVEMIHRFSRSPHESRSIAGTDARSPVDAFIRLACLTYGGDHVSRREEAKKLLAENPEIGRATIYAAATVGDFETVGAMLAKNPDLSRTMGGPHQWEPLLYVCYSRVNDSAASTLDVARLLLQNGADANAGYLWEGAYAFTALTGVFGEGESGPIHQPRHGQCAALARLLLERGADANDQQALYNRHFLPDNDHLRLLLEFGLGKGSGGPWRHRLPIDTSPQQIVGEEICRAAENNYIDRVRLLVETGADLQFKNAKGKTAYEIAVVRGNRASAEYLRSKQNFTVQLSPVDAFIAACMSADAKDAGAMLKSNPQLLVMQKIHGGDLIGQAARMNKLDAVRLMLDLGFEINTPGRASPLHSAAWAGNLEMVKLLKERGGDLTARDPSHNATPLDWARYNGKQEVVDYLEKG